MAQYESTKRAILKYHKYKLKRVPLDLNKKDFEERIKPAIDRAGMPVQTFIKAAINEKIAREGLDVPREDEIKEEADPETAEKEE